MLFTLKQNDQPERLDPGLTKSLRDCAVFEPAPGKRGAHRTQLRGLLLGALSSERTGGRVGRKQADDRLGMRAYEEVRGERNSDPERKVEPLISAEPD